MHNKGANAYLYQSCYSNSSTSTSTDFVYYALGSNQYRLNNSGNSYLLAYVDGSNNSNTINKWNTNLGLNSLTAWYFIAPTYSGTGNWSTSANWTQALVPASTTAAIIDGSVTLDANTTVSAVTINSGKSLTIPAGKQFTVNNALTNNGTFTLQSDATNGTATLLTNGTVTGTANINQYVSTGRNWYVSSPAGSAAPTGVSTTYSYNETTNNWDAGAFTAGKGNIVVPSATGNITFTGVLNNGNQTVNLTNTASNTVFGGFNLIGNPYPSNMDWMAVFAAASNIDPTMWYRTNTGSAYEYWTVNGTSGIGNPAAATKYIPPVQAFWVKVAAGQNSGTVNFTNAMRMHPAAANLLKAKKANEQPIVRLQVNNGINTDETVLYFDANATDGQDLYDSQKLTNGNVNIAEIYTVVNGVKTVINGMQNVPYDTPIPLGFSTLQAGTFTLGVNEFSNFAATESVLLIDNVANTETDLTAGKYTFSVTEPVTTANRFSIIFPKSGITTGVETNKNNWNLTVSESVIHISAGTDVKNGAAVVYNSIGQQVIHRNFSGKDALLQVNLRKGVYIVKVNEGTEIMLTKKVVIR